MRAVTYASKNSDRISSRSAFGLVAAFVAALGGCSALPTSGPTSAALQEQASSTSAPNFGLAEIDAHITDIQARRVSDSLRARFGDYRGAPGLQIGPGDTVAVTLWEAPPGSLFGAGSVDRSGNSTRTVQIPEQIVGRDGGITVPFAGRIPVAGRTSDEVQNTITSRLAGKAIEPQALVIVTRALSNAVAVTGEVTAGARIPLTPRGDRIMDVIASAGGVRAPVHESYVRLTRGNGAVSVPLSTILSNPQENVYVRPGDIITVVRDPQSYTVIGATGRNMTIPFDAQGISLAEGIARAGGLLDYRADAGGIYLLRFEPESIAKQVLPAGSPLVQPGRFTPIAYRLDMAQAHTIFLAQRFPMRNKDILYVANAPLSEVQKMLSIVQSVVSPAATGVGVASSLHSF